MTVKAPNGEVSVFTPHTYSEVWTVMTCGALRYWRVLDEATAPKNPHRVILRGASTAKEPAFIIHENSNTTRVSTEHVTDARAAWRPDLENVATISRLDKSLVQWSLDFIATYDARMEKPCTELALVDVEIKDLRPITTNAPNGEVSVFTPHTYSEVWTVMTCGALRYWRVLDEATAPENPHRVILRRASTN